MKIICLNVWERFFFVIPFFYKGWGNIWLNTPIIYSLFAELLSKFACILRHLDLSWNSFFLSEFICEFCHLFAVFLTQIIWVMNPSCRSFFKHYLNKFAFNAFTNSTRPLFVVTWVEIVFIIFPYINSKLSQFIRIIIFFLFLESWSHINVRDISRYR